MGAFMKEDDVFIASLLDLLNLRFGPTPERDWLGGIVEMAALQKEFQIFKRGRSFRDSVALLNMGGFWNARAKTRWYQLLDSLDQLPSNQARYKGGEAIVMALLKNFSSDPVLPVHFTAHDSRKDESVLVDGENRRPIFYIDQDYLTISIPMRPRAGRRPRRRRAS